MCIIYHAFEVCYGKYTNPWALRPSGYIIIKASSLSGCIFSITYLYNTHIQVVYFVCIPLSRDIYKYTTCGSIANEWKENILIIYI